MYKYKVVTKNAEECPTYFRETIKYDGNIFVEFGNVLDHGNKNCAVQERQCSGHICRVLAPNTVFDKASVIRDDGTSWTVYMSNFQSIKEIKFISEKEIQLQKPKTKEIVKHSNVCYVLKCDKDKDGNSIYKFEAVQSAKPFKNAYGLDLFEIDGDLTEGRCGMKMCNKSRFKEAIGQLANIEKFIDDAIKKYGLSPRYTRPEETKKDVFEKKESDGSFLATDVYNERHRYISVYNQKGIEFFVEKSDAEEFNATLFVMVNGYMVSVDQKHCMDEAVKKIESINANGGMLAYIEKQFNQMLSDPIRWADIGFARILSREEEANVHNIPIRKMRDETRAKEDAERKAREEQREKEEQEARDNMIAEAESNIKNHEKLMNNSIETEAGTETSIVLFLMKKYGIKVPIKTQGWINSALRSVTWDNGEVGYRYFKTSKESTVFMGYLKQLVEQICEASKCA